MPLYRKIQENGLLVGVWKTEETVEQLLALLGNISMYEKDLEHFTSDMRKYEWLAVRVLLKTFVRRRKRRWFIFLPGTYLADGSAHIRYLIRMVMWLLPCIRPRSRNRY